MKKGFLITLYGINNIGKSTQARLLINKIADEGFDAELLKYPVYDLAPTGPQLNFILRSGQKQSVSEGELQEIFAQNRRDYEPTLKKMIDDGKIIIAEDYTGTGVAWGIAKGLKKDYLEAMNDDLLKEDLAILLVGQRSMAAKEHKHIHETDDELVQRVDEILKRLAEEKNWLVISMKKDWHETAALIWDAVRHFFDKKNGI